MQASIETFKNGVIDNQRFFYIPVYQRNYSWKEEQCQVLFDDIMKLYHGEYQEHFIGSIVWKPEPNNSALLGVIDGQQRLTTMFLLIKAMVDNIEDEKYKCLLQETLVNSYKEKNRLVPIKKDNEVYEKLLLNDFDEITNKSSRIYLNYLFFFNELRKLDIDYEQLFESFDKLKIIKMELNHEDNPQVIFESINSTGISLSIADLIRNYLLMNVEAKKQEELFNNYWYKFEAKLGIDNLILFFEHYLNINISHKNINRSDMYNLFKSYFVENNFELEELFEIFSKEIAIYEYLVSDKVYKLTDPKLTVQLNKHKTDLQELNTKVCNMFLLPLFKFYETKIITEEELVYGFELTLSYIFRRSVIGVPTNSLQKLFRYLSKQVTEQMKNLSFIDSLHYAFITSKDDSNSKFPQNEEFYEALSHRNLYGKFRNLNYLLLSLENYNNKTVIQSDNLTIEHIMPQSLNSNWKKKLGSNYKQLHEQNVNDLGNLTLTSYNSNLSNYDFNKKKIILIEESHIKLNEYLKDKEEWNIDEIQKRGKDLAEIGLKIWTYPKVKENLQRRIEDNIYCTIGLDELYENYQSIKLKEVAINGTIKKISTINDLLDEIINYTFQIDSEKFNNIFVDSKDYLRTNKNQTLYIFTRNPQDDLSRKKHELSQVYYDTSRSGDSKIKLCKRILDEFKIPLDTIELKYYK